MYCPKCGRRLKDEDEFCPNCGAGVRRDTTEETEEPADDFDEEFEEDFEAESVEGFEEESVQEPVQEPAQGESEEDSEEEAAEEKPAAGVIDEEGAIDYSGASYDRAEESGEEQKQKQEKKEEKHTRISRPVFVVLFIVVSLLSLYVLYTLWDDEGEEERAAGEETIEAEANEEAQEGEEEAGEEDTAEEDVNGEDIVIEQENPADDYELEAFKESWEEIQKYGMDGSELYYRDFVESIYSYSDLSFTLESDTFEDLDDYYFIRAVFNKPVMVPVDLKPGDTYTIDIDELRGTVLTLTCTGSSDDQDYLEDSSGQQYYCSGSGYDQMANLYESSGARVDAPFYEGVLRIRLDAVTGDALTHGPYSHVTEADFADEDRWFDIVAFDEKGYVKQLIYDGN